MYRLALFLPILLLISCDKDAVGPSVCYTLTERQCAMDPYNAYFKDIKNEADRARSIRTYFKAQDIDLVDIKPNLPSTDAVCQACVCPNGYSYRLTLEVKDTNKLKSLDLLLSIMDCDN